MAGPASPRKNLRERFGLRRFESLDAHARSADDQVGTAEERPVVLARRDDNEVPYDEPAGVGHAGERNSSRLPNGSWL